MFFPHYEQLSVCKEMENLWHSNIGAAGYASANICRPLALSKQWQSILHAHF